MGVYSNFSISISNFDTEEHISDKKRKKILDKFNIDYSVSNEDINYYFNAKWYDMEEDMLSLSTEYPDLLFEVEVEVEDLNEYYIEYFHNNKNTVCNGKIVYEELNKKEIE